MSFSIDQILQFINTYYLNPIRTDEGYNPVNTFTWAIVLGICLFGVFKLLNKLEVKITPRFIASILPFVLAGSTLRVIEDSPAGIVHPLELFVNNSQYLLFSFCSNLICLWISIRPSEGRAGKRFPSYALQAQGFYGSLQIMTVLLHFQKIVAGHVPLFVIGAGTGTYLCFYLVAPTFEILDIYRSLESFHTTGSFYGCFFNLHWSRQIGIL